MKLTACIGRNKRDLNFYEYLMSRIGISHLLAWYNSKPNKISKINLVKKSYLYYQTYCYIKSSAKTYVNGISNVNNSLNWCYITDCGIIRTKYKILQQIISTHRVTIKNYTFVIGGNYIEIKYPSMKVCCIKQNHNMELLIDNYFDLKIHPCPFNLLDNLGKLITDITSFAKDKESYFRELKNRQSNGASV